MSPRTSNSIVGSGSSSNKRKRMRLENEPVNSIIDGSSFYQNKKLEITKELSTGEDKVEPKWIFSFQDDEYLHVSRPAQNGGEEEAMSYFAKTKGKKQSDLKKHANCTAALTDAEIQAFLDGIPTIADWSCDGIEPDYCKIIEWIDKDELEMKEVVRRWIEELKRPVENKDSNVAANIYKHYKKYSPLFYQKKLNLACPSKRDKKSYVAAQKRKAAINVWPRTAKDSGAGNKLVEKEGVRITKKKTLKSSVMGGTPSLPERIAFTSDSHTDQAAEDINLQSSDFGKDDTDTLRLHQNQQLEILFSQLSAPEPAPIHALTNTSMTNFRNNKQNKPKSETTAGPTPNDITRYFANRNSAKVLHFKHSAGDALLGHPSRPVLDFTCATISSPYLAAAAKYTTNLQLISYDDTIKDATIARYIACISPSLRKDLPTHDLIETSNNEVLATEIQWTMQELKDLYIFAQEMETWDVVDIVMDRIHFEAHSECRVTVNEYGEQEAFDILDITPDFLGYLKEKNDDVGLQFFTDILVMKRRSGMEHVLSYGLDAWDDATKGILIEKLQQNNDTVISLPDPDSICMAFHHHHPNPTCYRTLTPYHEPNPPSQHRPDPAISTWRTLTQHNDISTAQQKAKPHHHHFHLHRQPPNKEKHTQPPQHQTHKHDDENEEKESDPSPHLLKKHLTNSQDAMPCIPLSHFLEQKYTCITYRYSES